MNKKLILAALSMALVAVGGTFMIARPIPVVASDHDDGETDTKTKNTNMTDMYVMREADLTGQTFGTAQGDNDNLILAMYVNPRSIARQQYFFNQNATYTFHIGAVGTDRTVLTNRGSETLRLKFTFNGENSVAGTQNATVAVVPVTTQVSNGAITGVTEGTPVITRLANGIQPEPPAGLGLGATPQNSNLASITTSNFTVNGQQCTFFAGLREDTFTFDVNQFFRVRAFALGKGPAPVGGVVFRPHVPNAGWAQVTSPGLDEGSNVGSAPSLNNASIDFPKDFNVLAIVLKVPATALQVNGDTVFDVQGTIEEQQ